MYYFWRGGTGKSTIRPGCGCLSIPSSTIWIFFALMYVFTKADAIAAEKWEFVWGFFAGPYNFLF